MEADWQRCLTEVMEVSEVTEVMELDMFWPLPLLLSVLVSTDSWRLTGRGVGCR